MLEAGAIIAAGFAAGSINAVVGSGTLVTFPTLLALGYSPVVANVSNTVGLVPGSVAGAWGYRDGLAGQRGTLTWLAFAGTLGGAGGAVLLLVLPTDAFEAIVPALLLVACLLVAGQPALSRHRRQHSPDAHRAVVGWLLVLATAIYGGYFGAAQGVLLLAVLGFVLNDSLQRLNAVKNVQTGLMNAVAGVVFAVGADVDWAVAALIAVGSCAGGLVGASIGRRLPTFFLRWVIVSVGGIAAVVLLTS